MSFGGSSSESGSSSWSNNFANSIGGSSQSVYGPQAGFLQNLWQQGSNAVNAAGAPTDAQPYIDSGNAMLGNVQGLTDWQGQVDSQMNSLQSGLSDFWNQGRNTIGDNAGAAGAFGGSRHGMAEAALAGEVSDALVQGGGDIMSNARSQALTAAGMGTQMGQSLFGLGEAGRMSNFSALNGLAGLLGSPITLGESFSESNAQGQSQSSSFGEESKMSLGFK